MPQKTRQSHIPTAATGAMVALNTQIPDDAMTADLLGTRRSGHGAVIRRDGLIVTVGYIISEADSIWITSHNGSTVPGYVVAYDHDSGLGLVKPSLPLKSAVLALSDAAELRIGDTVYIAGSGGSDDIQEARVIARHEFAGRWEYVIDDAIFAAPAHEHWAGAALLDGDGRLIGIGSLMVQTQREADTQAGANMFIPVHLIAPHIDDICVHGARNGVSRPWLGMLVQDDEDQLTVVGVYRGCPADRGGLLPGDVILRVGDRPVRGLATLFRQIWHQGPAGTDIPLTILRSGSWQEIRISSSHLNMFHRRGTVN